VASTRNMVAGAPIVTVSFGEARKFRLSRDTGDARQVRDFPASHGTVFVLPQETNAVWKHAVPKSARYMGRRISVTIRGFYSDAD
jgi:alkylated DNA repair dioxygenase AlkB